MNGQRIRYFLLILLPLIALSVSARMYQWTEPATGITQLSGKPPPWYRSAAGGPRVFVFENGRVIDDTGIQVSDTERQQLREKALVQALGDEKAAASELEAAERLKAEFRAPEPKPVAQVAPATPPVPAQDEEQAQAAKAPQGGTPSPTEEQMRELIQRWEAVQAQAAKKAADGQAPAP